MSSFYVEETGLESLSNLPRVIKLVTGKDFCQDLRLPEPYLFLKLIFKVFFFRDGAAHKGDESLQKACVFTRVCGSAESNVR